MRLAHKLFLYIFSQYLFFYPNKSSDQLYVYSMLDTFIKILIEVTFKFTTKNKKNDLSALKEYFFQERNQNFSIKLSLN